MKRLALLWVALGVALVVTMSACSDTSATLEPVDDPASAEGVVHLVEVVDGIEVVTPSYLPELQRKVWEAEFHVTAIDEGTGPVVCLGMVLTSLPPSCGGPRVLGLDMGDWAEVAAGVAFGERALVVTWPPVDDVVELVSDRPYEPPTSSLPNRALPTACADIEVLAGAEDIQPYARALNPDSFGGLFVTDDGVLVLQVTDDLDRHRAALDLPGRAACVIEVPWSEREQRAATLAVERAVEGSFAALGVGPGLGGLIEVWVPVADREAAQALAELVDDPAMVRLVATGIVVSGKP